MTLVDHMEEIERKRGTMEGEGDRKMVKKEMKTLREDRNMDGFQMEWKIRRIAALASCLLARSLVFWFQLWASLSVSLPTSNPGFLQTCSSHRFTPRILSNKNTISSTYGWKKARGCDCFNPEWHTVWLQTRLKPQVSNPNLVNVRIALTDKTPLFPNI